MLTDNQHICKISATFMQIFCRYCRPYCSYAAVLQQICDRYLQTFHIYVSLVREVKNNKSIFKKPWLSKGLLKAVRQKNRLYKRYLNSPSVNNNLKYKRFKNKLNHSIRIAKRLYYEQQLDRNKSNCKKTWNILNEIINKRNQTRRLPSTFVTDNQECSDPLLIADQFCKYFSNFGPNLVRKIQNVPISPN